MSAERLTTAQARALLEKAGYEEDRNLRSRFEWVGWCEGRLCGMSVHPAGYTQELDGDGERVADGTNAKILEELEWRRKRIVEAMRLIREAEGVLQSEGSISITISSGDYRQWKVLSTWEHIAATDTVFLQEQADPNE